MKFAVIDKGISFVAAFCAAMVLFAPATLGSDSNASTRGSFVELIIHGPEAVPENSVADYEAELIVFGTGFTVTDRVRWYVSSSFATIDSTGRLTTSEVENDETVRLAAVFLRWGAYKVGLKNITVQNNGDPLQTSHAGRFDVYEGSATCNRCHLERAYEVHESVHYQWKGMTPEVVNIDEGGKLGSINDFCTYPDVNFTFEMTNADGMHVLTGCAKCHVGSGRLPAPTPTSDQLENIDCLVCHSDAYRRKLVEIADGEFGFVPDPENMNVDLLEAITDIGVPSKAACLNCHAKAGGGDGLKQGDMEMAHADPPPSLDVHMASREKGGAGLECLDCHVSEAHKIAGRGDLRPTELAVKVACTSCHTQSPHGDDAIDKHTERVDCAVCHIPSFARGVPTDMVRDFTATELVEVKQMWEPAISKETNVVPAYKFYNGESYFYEFGDPIDSPEGHLISGPIGDITDERASIFPFKVHSAIMAYDLDQMRLIPVNARVLWGTGDADAAIRQGAADVGWSLENEYAYVATERYMPVFHEVAPEEEALRCDDCHNGGERMNFDALGYSPRVERLGRPLCTSCHEDKSDEWTQSEFFMRVHDKHVRDKRFDCGECHKF